MKITDISIKRPSLVIVVFTALTLLGLLSYFSLGYELLPKFSNNVVSISTIYPGASPNEVENTVTKKIEDAVSSMENIKKINSVSFESLSTVTITLTDAANIDISLNDAQRKVNAILSDLPEDVKTPSLSKFSLDDLPVITMSASANMDDITFYDLIDKRIAPVISRVSGIAQVNLVGGSEREIQVSLDADKLQGYNLSVPQVQQLILSSNLDFPTGSVKTQNQDVLIRLSGKYRSMEELRNLVLTTTKDGAQIRLGDVADVQDSQKETEKLARIDRKASIAIQIIKQSDANAVEVSKGVHAIIAKLKTEYAANKLDIRIVNDSSIFTLESADAVIHDLILAVILVAFVMLFFLHSLRNALIVMVSIPVSLIATFIGISLFGFTLNLMSLLGLSLVVGILVDDAIVVLENIQRHMEMGKNKVRAASDATREIGFTVVSITFVIVVVFFPIAVSTGLVSNILRQFCIVVIIATLLSLVASFTIVPLIFSRFGKLERIEGKNLFGRFILWFEKQLKKFTLWITSILTWSLNHKALTLVMVVVMFLSSCGLLVGGFIGSEFFPKSDKGEFLVQLELPKDASLEQTNFLTQKAEAFLDKQPEITQLITTVGQSTGDFGGTQATAYKSEINVKLVERDERKGVSSDIFATKMSRALAKELIGAKVKTVPISILGIAENAPIQLVVMGSDLDSALKYAEGAQKVLAAIPGATEIKLSVEKGTPEINVQVDRDKMSAVGLTLQTVGSTMQTAFAGNTDGKYRKGEYEYDINIQYQNFNRQNIDDVRNLIFVNSDGKQIKLSQFATITEGSGPSQLERLNKSTSVSVKAQSIGRPTGTVVAEFQAKLEELQKNGKLKAPIGVSYSWAGDQENQSEGFGTLGIALLASIILVYLIMVALYDSFIYPLVVMFSLPLAVIGALLALALTNNSIGIFTILGLIMLMGLVAKNAIILVDFTNHLKAEGKETKEALVLANHARLRPILMTTIAMVFGMLPIALASGAGAEWKNGLAWVIVGGLTSSLFLTLIVVPVVYLIFDRMLERLGFNKKGKTIDELMVEPYKHKDVNEYDLDHGH
ncbi:Multidrug resistance protein MdtC [Pedobacter sp. Bi27]|jgi:HAE1 family hydrophobic/amphiphilic exporter-1|uniref:efflux RND transporter permease subunit n=1 Tax=unclassified Pedobacter TaxID=2628915 RepID=UPI001D556A52|nr:MULTISPECIES: efflux RND transporter permease subunit [unclassified Pedobacter]CAH0159772.1 Multidrug resistance protein MdtC [Pedobacter sp. Bi36]CAH0184002.1 Multidrug resistance protein MdtC [Pedobacter sp. Bi27]CAH0215619.1 Multidrug resistance protein MdtC [Pedobacter sp. Bi126]